MGGHEGPMSVVTALLWVDGRQRQEDVWTLVAQIAYGCSSGQQEMLSQRKLSADAEAVLQPPHVCRLPLAQTCTCREKAILAQGILSAALERPRSGRI